MMAVLRYLTHPDVRVEPAVPVPGWSLSDVGRSRAVAMLAQPWMHTVSRIVSSDECKAVETARIVGDHLGLAVEVREGIGENDRSATGFRPAEEFERLADRFFGEPEASVAGWERASDAQQRIVRGLADLFADCQGSGGGDVGGGGVIVVGHGGVGTLLQCWLRSVAISRAFDQPGQGHYFTVDLVKRELLHGWRAIDRF